MLPFVFSGLFFFTLGIDPTCTERIFFSPTDYSSALFFFKTKNKYIMIQAQQTNILSLDVEQKMAGSEQKTSKPNQEKNPQHEIY